MFHFKNYKRRASTLILFLQLGQTAADANSFSLDTDIADKLSSLENKFVDNQNFLEFEDFMKEMLYAVDYDQENTDGSTILSSLPAFNQPNSNIIKNNQVQLKSREQRSLQLSNLLGLNSGFNSNNKLQQPSLPSQYSSSINNHQSSISSSSSSLSSTNTDSNNFNSKNFGYICTAESSIPYSIKDGLGKINRDGVTADFTSTRAMLLRELESLKSAGSYKDLEKLLLKSANLLGDNQILGRSMNFISDDDQNQKQRYNKGNVKTMQRSMGAAQFQHDPTYVKTWKCCNNIRYDSLNLDCCTDLTVARTCEGFTQWSEWSSCPTNCDKNNKSKSYQTRKRSCIINNNIVVNQNTNNGGQDVVMPDGSFVGMQLNQPDLVNEMNNLLDYGLNLEDLDLSQLPAFSNFQDYPSSVSLRRKKRAIAANEVEPSKLNFINKHIFSEATLETTKNYGCKENLEEIRPCPTKMDENKCWREWSSWSDCNCETDTKVRHRSCPVYGNCQGQDFEEASCQEECKLKMNTLDDSLSCFSCKGGSSNEECLGSATSQMCSAGEVYASYTASNKTEGSRSQTLDIQMGCQSQIQTINGKTEISKSCQSIVDCYVDSAGRLATGECDPLNPLNSNCVFCCEDEYCNYDSHFESSFYLVLKMANFRRSKLTLKSGGVGLGHRTKNNSKLGRQAVSDMYKEYKVNKKNIDRQIRKKGGKGLRKLIDLSLG